jgi:AcrR family transcriptional regulator
VSDKREHEEAPARPRGRPRLDARLVPQILDAAERLFAEHGPVSVSIRDIAAEAGLPHSAIYRYFESKDEVLRQVLLRGRKRQREHEVEERLGERAWQGAIEWVMQNNRAYALVLARLALAGETTSSLGIDPAETVARQSVAVLEGGTYPFEVRTDHDPRAVVAALMALTVGWVVAEDWILDAVGMHGRDHKAARAEIDELLGSMMALGAGPRKECGPADKGPETTERNGTHA